MLYNSLVIYESVYKLLFIIKNSDNGDYRVE